MLGLLKYERLPQALNTLSPALIDPVSYFGVHSKKQSFYCWNSLQDCLLFMFYCILQYKQVNFCGAIFTKN